MNKKPSAIHEASGAYKKNSQRRRKGEPKPRLGIGAAPTRPPSTFAKVWDELVDNICPGVLGNSDRIHMEMTVNLLIEYRRAPEEMSSAKWTNLMRALGHMGMNPIDRTRIIAEQGDQKSKEDDYF